MSKAGSEGKKVLVRQTRSTIGRSAKFRRTLCALGLGNIGDQTTLVVNPSVQGMLRCVEHIVEVTPAN